IDPVHKALPLIEYTYLPFGFPLSGDEERCIADMGAVNFFDLKAQYYKKRRPNEHYAIFGFRDLRVNEGLSFCDQMILGEGGRSAGIPGADFFVAAGAADLNRFPLAPAGAFMHELGHNLGLHHGGDEDLNYKPNYISVMNYFFQSGIHAA